MGYDESKDELAEIREILKESIKNTEEWRKESRRTVDSNAKAIQESIKNTEEWRKESRKLAENNAKDTEEWRKESRRLAENNAKDTGEWRKESRRLINELKGGFDNRWGDFVEVITRENLARLLEDYGINVHRVHANIEDEKNRRWEIDAMAVNGEEIVIVETKTSLSIKKVKRFIERKLSRVRTYFPEYKDKKFYGAVSYLKSKIGEGQDSAEGRDAAEYALDQGLFVISVVGNTARMLNDRNFKPKIF